MAQPEPADKSVIYGNDHYRKYLKYSALVTYKYTRSDERSMYVHSHTNYHRKERSIFGWWHGMKLCLVSYRLIPLYRYHTILYHTIPDHNRLDKFSFLSEKSIAYGE